MSRIGGLADMNLTRRTWLGGAVSAGAGISVLPSSMPSAINIRQTETSPFNYGSALDALRAYALLELRSVGLPGMTLSVVDAEGFVALMTFGWADVDRGIPVAPNHVFQI